MADASPIPADDERDTDDTEEAVDLARLLLPPGASGDSLSFRTDVARFSISYNARALRGWVKQPSPCCAAAVVAGAVNAVRGVPRDHAAAADHGMVLEIYVNMVTRQLEKKRASFERRLGADIGDVLEAWEARLEEQGTPIGGKKGTGPTRKAQMRVLRELVEAAAGGLAEGPEAKAAAAEDVRKEADSKAETEAEVRGCCRSSEAPEAYERLWELFAADRDEECEGASATMEGGADGAPGTAEDETLRGVEDKVLEGVGPVADDETPREAGEPDESTLGEAEVPVRGPVSVCFDVSLPRKSRKRGKRRGPPANLRRRLEARQRSTEEPETACAPAASVLESDSEAASEPESDSSEASAPIEDASATNGEALATLDEASRGDKPATRPKRRRKPWDWKADFLEIIKKRTGVVRLTHALKPSTAPIGNWGVISAVKELGTRIEATCHGDVGGRLFMGRGKRKKSSKIAVPVQGTMAASEVEHAWAELRTAFLATDSVLIFHLRNHYALIYALREWEEEMAAEDVAISGGDSEAAAAHVIHPPGPVQVRQMLTARRGQRPSEWLDFEEAVETMCRWDGYKIIQVRRKRDIDAK